MTQSATISFYLPGLVAAQATAPMEVAQTEEVIVVVAAAMGAVEEAVMVVAALEVVTEVVTVTAAEEKANREEVCVPQDGTRSLYPHLKRTSTRHHQLLRIDLR